MCKYCQRIEDEHFVNAKEGDLRIWWVPQIPMESFDYPVSSVGEAKRVLELLAQYDLFQFEHNVKLDYSNTGGLQVFENGEWSEWIDEDGNCIEDTELGE